MQLKKKNAFYWKIVNIIKRYRYFLELIYKAIAAVLNIFQLFLSSFDREKLFKLTVSAI